MHRALGAVGALVLALVIIGLGGLLTQQLLARSSSYVPAVYGPPVTATQETSSTPTAQQTTLLQPVLPEQTASLYVHVEEVRAEEPIKNAGLILQYFDGHIETAKTDPDGNAWFTNVPVGDAVISVGADGYESQREQVLLPDIKNVLFDLEIDRR